MKVLLDECVPRNLRAYFATYDCWTAPSAGFAGLQNGFLLSAAEEAGFDLLVTLDRGIRFQQNLKGRRIAIVLIRARTNRLADLLPHIEACLDRIRTIQAGEIAIVGDTVDL